MVLGLFGGRKQANPRRVDGGKVKASIFARNFGRGSCHLVCEIFGAAVAEGGGGGHGDLGEEFGVGKG
jgi:hypothetical protein